MNEQRAWPMTTLALAALLLLTRSHHVGDITHLPDASWAVFFVAGFYRGTRGLFVGLLALAATTDLAAVTWFGVSDFCVSPAYAFLVPAYGALFLAGRWYASRHRLAWQAALPFIVSGAAGALVCELFASGGFYFFSGRFAEPDLTGFAERLALYLPGSLESFALWLGVAAVVHVALTLATARMVRAR